LSAFAAVARAAEVNNRPQDPPAQRTYTTVADLQLKQQVVLDSLFIQLELDKQLAREVTDNFSLQMQKSLNNTSGALLGQVKHTDQTDYFAEKIVDAYARSAGQLTPQGAYLHTHKVVFNLRTGTDPSESPPSVAGAMVSTALKSGAQAALGKVMPPTAAKSIVEGGATLISNDIRALREKAWQEVRETSERGAVNRGVNYRIIEHIMNSDPALYDAIRSALNNASDSSNSTPGLMSDKGSFLPSRPTESSLGFSVGTGIDSLIAKGKKGQLSEAEKNELKALLKSVDDKVVDYQKKLDQLNSNSLKVGDAKDALGKELEKRKIEARTTEELPDDLRDSSIAKNINQTRETMRESLKEFNLVGQELGGLLARIDPKAGAVVKNITSIYSTLAIGLSGGGKTLKLSDFLSVTNLAFSLVDILLGGGPDPTMQYLERMDKKLDQIYSAVNDVKIQIRQLEEVMREQFRITQASINAGRFDQQKGFEGIRALLSQGFENLQDTQDKIKETVDRIDLLCRVTLHIGRLTLEGLEQSMKRQDTAIQGNVNPDYSKAFEQLRQAIAFPNKFADEGQRRTEEERLRTLQRYIVENLTAVAGLRSEDAWILYCQDSQFAESWDRAIRFLNLARQPRAVAKFLRLDTVEHEEVFRGLLDIRFFSDAVNALAYSSGERGFPHLDSKMIEALKEQTARASSSITSLGKAVLLYSVTNTEQQMVRLLNTAGVEQQRKVPIVLDKGAFKCDYDLTNGPQSVQSAADALGFTGVGTTVSGLNADATIQRASSIEFKSYVADCHWYQKGLVKEWRNVAVGRERYDDGGMTDRGGGWVTKYDRQLVDVPAMGSCGGPGEVAWYQSLKPMSVWMNAQDREIGVGRLLIQPAICKAKFLAAFRGNGSQNLLALSADPVALEVVKVSPTKAEFIGNSGRPESNPYCEGDPFYFSFKARQLATVRPVFRGSIGAAGMPLATYTVNFEAEAENLPTAVESESVHRVKFITGKYIEYLGTENFPGARGLKPESSSSDDNPAVVAYHSPSPNQFLDLTMYLEASNSLIEPVAPLLMATLVKNKGAAWLDGLSKFVLSAKPTGDGISIGYFEREGKKFLRVEVGHHKDGVGKVEVELPSTFVPSALAPRVNVQFPLDLSVTRNCPADSSALPRAAQVFIDMEREFHRGRSKEFVANQLGGLKEPGNKLQQGYVSFGSAMLLLRQALSEFGSEVLRVDRELAARDGTDYLGTIQGLLSERKGSLLSFGVMLDEISEALDSNKEISAQSLITACTTVRQGLAILGDRVNRAVAEGAVFNSVELSRTMATLEALELRIKQEINNLK
jgi:hypothetical protein